MTEQWKQVAGFEGLYDVSNFGRIRSLPRGTISGRIMSVALKKVKYVSIGLCKNGVQYRRKLHRLILAAFVGPCPDGMEGCHNDGNPSNNRLDNLRWDTHQNNMMDSWNNGRESLKGSRNGKAKMTEDTVREIKSLLKLGKFTQKEIAIRFFVSQPTINNIARGKNWTHVS